MVNIQLFQEKNSTMFGSIYDKGGKTIYKLINLKKKSMLSQFFSKF